MEPGAISLGELWAAARRRGWLLFACVVFFAPVSLVIAVGLPAKYTSSAKVLVEARQIPDSLVRSTVQVGAAERLALLRERLLTRDNLLNLAERFDLFRDRPDITKAETRDALLRSIAIADVPLRDRRLRAGGPVLASAFTISYSADDPVTAARVANALAAMALTRNTELRASRAAETRRFLERGSRDLAVELEALEREIAAFKSANDDALPETLAARRLELSRLREARRALREEAFALGERKLTLAARVAAMRAPAPILAAEAPPPSRAERDLAALEKEFALSLSVFTEKHPNMRALAARIAVLRSAIASEGAPASFITAPADLVAISEAHMEIAAAERRGAAIREELARLDERSAALDAAIRRTPEVEIALAALERRRGDMAARYEDALEKEAAAAVGEQLEIARQVERYGVIEPAEAPEAPDWPPRKLIALGGAGGAFALGLLLMAAAEMSDRTVRSAAQIERRIAIRPLASIPLAPTRRARWRRMGRVALGAVALLALTCAALFVLGETLAPLDVVGTRLLDQLGLSWSAL
ncbi:MAG: Wzz/FepE/Etk N-terminal domain-containing protein [Pseudomonadota bacterium]